MKLDPIGRIADVEPAWLEPLVVPIIGYTESAEEVVTEIRFLATAPPAFMMEMMESVDEQGNIREAAIIKYINSCIHPEDRDAWEHLTRRTDVSIFPSTLVALYQALGEFYAQRPSQRRSGSHGGGKNLKPTSGAAASSRASSRKTSR